MSKPPRTLGIVRHGHTANGNTSSTYKTWVAMVARCTSESCKDWPYYGARGVAVCDRWRVFDNFLIDMGERPDGMTLDRIDNGRGYELGNCRWSTKTTQARNRSSTVLDENMVREIRARNERGESKADIGRSLGIPRTTVSAVVFRRSWKDVA